VKTARYLATVFVLYAAVGTGCVSGNLDVDLGHWEVGPGPGVRNLPYAEHVEIDYKIRPVRDEEHVDLYVYGTVSNTGPLTLGKVNVIANCFGRNGEVVKDEKDDIIDGVLGAGRSKSFQFKIDDVPRLWDGNDPTVDIYEVRTLD